jgi:tetratricopeptide (TPR) repeat protein
LYWRLESAMQPRRQERKARRSTRLGAELPLPAGRFSVTFLPVVLLFAAPLILYSGTLQYPLAFDDIGLREGNLQKYSLAWQQFGMRWVSYATFGWTYELVGFNLPWHRLGNVVLHALTTIALFALLRRLFGAVLTPPRSADSAVELSPGQLAFFGALIFALHPVSAYGVVYLVERSIVMATLFSVLSLRAYLEGLLCGRLRWLLGAAALYLLAVFSKEHCVMLPGVAIALTLLLRKPSWSLVREIWLPFAMFLLIGMLIVFKAKGILGAPYEPLAPRAAAHLSDGGGGQIYFLSVITECWLFFKYLFLWIAPNPAWLSVDLRQKFAAELLSWPETAGFLAFVLYPLFAAWMLLKGGRKGLAGFGLLFPWLFFLTELSTVRIQEPFVLYRAYLWTGGLAAMVPLLSPPISVRWKVALLSSICLVMVPLTLNRLDSFSSAWKLWNDVVEKNTDKKLFFTERGYNKRGIASIGLGNYHDAIRDFTTSLEINRKDPDIYLNRGMASLQLGNYPDALSDFAAGLEINPKEPGFYVNRGIVYAANQRFAEAVAEFDRALEFNAGNPVALFNRGQTLRLMSRYDEGTANIRKSCELGHPSACGALMAPR